MLGGKYDKQPLANWNTREDLESGYWPVHGLSSCGLSPPADSVDSSPGLGSDQCKFLNVPSKAGIMSFHFILMLSHLPMDKETHLYPD